MRCVLFAGLLITPTLSWAQSPASPLDQAIRRGAAFLARDAHAWNRDHNCLSCHHAALIARALHETRQSGVPVDDTLLEELTSQMAGSGTGETRIPRPADRPRALNTKAVWFALALEADADPSESVRSGLTTLLETVMKDQTGDGSWVAWPQTRAPMFGGSDASMTALAAWTLAPAASLGSERARSSLDQAVRWLCQNPPDGELQSLAVRLIVWQKTGQPQLEVRELADRLARLQRADGGWSQFPGVASDAWATGQALYALAGILAPTDPALTRGQQFLIQSQTPEGAWVMESRPTTPGGAGADLLVPITGAGSAWAVLGLVRSRSAAVVMSPAAPATRPPD